MAQSGQPSSSFLFLPAFKSCEQGFIFLAALAAAGEVASHGSPVGRRNAPFSYLPGRNFLRDGTLLTNNWSRDFPEKGNDQGKEEI